MKTFNFLSVLFICWSLSVTQSQNFWEATNGPCSGPPAQVASLAINSSDYIFAAVCFQGVYRTADNGDNWIEINNGLIDTLPYSLAINSSDHIFLGTIESGAFRSTDNGENWTQINNGLTTSNVLTLAINSSDQIFAGSTYGVYRSTNNGDNWIHINNGLTNTLVLTLAINSGGYVFAGTQGGGVFLSTNNGGNWSQINNGLSNTNVLSLAINSNDHIFAGTSDGVFRLTNYGGSWLHIGLPAIEVKSLTINSIGHIFAGTDMNGVYRSTNNGDSWIQINSGLIYTEGTSFAINSEGYIFVGNYMGIVYRSTASTIPVELISFIAVANTDVVELNWATATETNNSGFSIERKSTNSEYSEIGFVPGFGTITETKSYSFTDSKISAGIYAYRLKQIDFDGSFEYSDEVEVQVSTPLVFLLVQNYPNPFNPSTNISWQSPISSWQTLKIYDVLGNEVATLANEYKPAGAYEIEWDASEFLSGVYFYQLKTENYFETKKMILLK